MSGKKLPEDDILTMPLEEFQTGYVIELEYMRYFSGIKRGRICSSSLDGAKYFTTMSGAERYVYRHLGYVGMRANLCRACWTLVEVESLEEGWKFLTGKDGRTVKFASYQDARRYQMEESLEKMSMV